MKSIFPAPTRLPGMSVGVFQVNMADTAIVELVPWPSGRALRQLHSSYPDPRRASNACLDGFEQLGGFRAGGGVARKLVLHHQHDILLFGHGQSLTEFVHNPRKNRVWVSHARKGKNPEPVRSQRMRRSGRVLQIF